MAPTRRNQDPALVSEPPENLADFHAGEYALAGALNSSTRRAPRRAEVLGVAAILPGTWRLAPLRPSRQPDDFGLAGATPRRFPPIDSSDLEGDDLPTIRGIPGPSLKPRIKSLHVTDESISADLVDGRTISVPLAWSWRISEATPEQRAHFEVLADGQGAHWPEIDEDISVEGMLYGSPARRPRSLEAEVRLSG
jgi:hypothetical protein